MTNVSISFPLKIAIDMTQIGSGHREHTGLHLMELKWLCSTNLALVSSRMDGRGTSGCSGGPGHCVLRDDASTGTKRSMFPWHECLAYMLMNESF